MIKKFEETGSIMESKLPVRHRTDRSVDSIAVVSESIAESPGKSICNMITEFLWPRLDGFTHTNIYIYVYIYIY
jgi:hypothetical protein